MAAVASEEALEVPPPLMVLALRASASWTVEAGQRLGPGERLGRLVGTVAAAERRAAEPAVAAASPWQREQMNASQVAAGAASHAVFQRWSDWRDQIPVVSAAR